MVKQRQKKKLIKTADKKAPNQDGYQTAVSFPVSLNILPVLIEVQQWAGIFIA